MIAPARALAFETIRGDLRGGRLHRARLPRGAPSGSALGGRERAQAQRLAYGAVQRRGTADAAIERLAERSTRLLDPPVLAALRLGLYELLFADGTPDHAAVDQAVELVKGAGAAHASGLVNAVLRRAARERERADRGAARRRLDPGARRGRPLGAALAGADVVGGARRRGRPLAARRLQRAGRGGAAGRRARGDREAVLATLREAGVEARAPRRRAGRWPPPESIVVAGRTGDAVPERVAAGELTPQSRGSAAVVEVLDPRPGEHVLDLCAGPGDQDRPDRRADGGPRRGDLGRARPRRGRPKSPTRRGGSACAASPWSRPTRPSWRWRRASTASSSTRPARTSARSPRAPTRAGASRRGRSSAWSSCRSAILRAAARALRPGGTLVYSTCTISRRENEDRVAALLDAAAAGEVPALAVDDLGARAPELASPVEPRCLQLRPDRDRTTGFFIARLRRDD